MIMKITDHIYFNTDHIASVEFKLRDDREGDPIPEARVVLSTTPAIVHALIGADAYAMKIALDAMNLPEVRVKGKVTH